ncbi:MAG: prepilin-type N-terminal cleavage/methylation domain-containing protein [Candidatus Adiutrix sp.]|jgi:prepilin-type N-terminal cleavage/methylation domain-containing protein|nr:prepilin-type N-terminal cleavage/methylation domain-containing protein [Candidatus Adiutrix sp.]
MAKKAFTLIEVMIVLAIAAVLAMIAVPLFRSYLDRAKDVAAGSSLQQVAVSQELHAQANNGSYTSDWTELGQCGFQPDPNVRYSPITIYTAFVNGGPQAAFSLMANHRSGRRVFQYDSALGRGVEMLPDTEPLMTAEANMVVRNPDGVLTGP